MEKTVIKSSQFGELEVSPENVFTFEEGLLGFEEYKKYVLISDEITEPFKWLIALEEPEIGFPIVNPWHIDIEYNPGKKYNYEVVVPMVIVTIGGGVSEMTANMKAPLLLNIEDMSGEQIIIASDKYSTNEKVHKI